MNLGSLITIYPRLLPARPVYFLP